MASQELSKSAGTYVLGAVQISLELLQSLSNLIPFPYVTAVVGAASQLIQIAQTVQNNVEGVGLLIERIKAIILVILTSLKGKSTQDVPSDLALNIGHLSTDLAAIDKDVRRVKKRTDTSSVVSRMKATVRYGDNAGLIAECTSRLEWAMRRFEVESRIQESIRIAQLANEVHEVHEDVKGVHEDVRGVQRGVDTVQQGIDTILESLDLTSSSALPSATIPRKPEIFYGRDVEVEEIAHRIASTRPSRLGITGPGGIGKTSLASAVLEHIAVVELFESRIHWSRCDGATSLPLLIEVIAKSFGLDQPSKDRLQDITSFLRSNTHPRLLVLDNFETPWDIEGRQSDIIDILGNLWAFSHLSVLVTMRGTLPGVGRIKWTKPELPTLAVLSMKASRDLYVEIDPKADGDTVLETLLSELDHMPLAVTLMAKVGSEGETPTELLKKWKARGTEVIHEEGGDRRTSVNISIQLSLNSHLMQNNPGAFRLLSVLAVLPGGIRNDIIQAMVPDALDPTKARSVLLRTSLVYSRAQTNSFHVLSPIRTYIVHHHSPTPLLWRGLHEFCCDYIQQHDPKPWDESAFIKALAIEDVNLEAILSHALQHNPSEAIIQAALRFTWYQYLTHVRTGPSIAIVAVTAAERVGTAYQVAACHQRLGFIYSHQEQLKDARIHLEAARAKFLRLSKGWEAACCAQELGYAARSEGRYGDARGAFEKARHELETIGNLSGSADSLMGLGDIALMEGRYNDARTAYEDAKVQKLSLGETTVYCVQGLGDVARMEGRYRNSRESHELARAEAIERGNQISSVYNLLCLGIVDMMNEQYKSAREALREAQEEFVQLRDPNGAAECLKWLGNLDRGEGRCEEARRNLGEAYAQFLQLGLLPDAAECLQGLGYAEAVEGRWKAGRQHLEEALGMFRRLGIPKGVADSLSSLGELSAKEGRVTEARSNLEEAQVSYEKMGVQDWWQSRCIALLAGLPSSSDWHQK